MSELIEQETALLKLLSDYGDGLDLSGPRVGADVKFIARELIRKGLAGGSLRSLTMTDKGRAATPPRSEA